MKNEEFVRLVLVLHVSSTMFGITVNIIQPVREQKDCEHQHDRSKRAGEIFETIRAKHTMDRGIWPSICAISPIFYNKDNNN